MDRCCLESWGSAIRHPSKIVLSDAQSSFFARVDMQGYFLFEALVDFSHELMNNPDRSLIVMIDPDIMSLVYSFEGFQNVHNMFIAHKLVFGRIHKRNRNRSL